MAENSAQQVSKIKRIMEDLSIEVASSDQARQMLDLKGIHKVSY
jgi:uncharacterized protein (DUF849 family)